MKNKTVMRRYHQNENVLLRLRCFSVRKMYDCDENMSLKANMSQGRNYIFDEKFSSDC